MKKFLALILSLILIFAFFGCSDDETEKVTVKIEVDCSDILNNYSLLDKNLKDEKYVPSTGFIIEETQIEVNAGDDAIDALVEICKANSIAVDYSNGYVKGINQIYEGSCGEMSGWVYEINGEPIMTEYTVSEGALISWIYICDFSQMSFE